MSGVGPGVKTSAEVKDLESARSVRRLGTPFVSLSGVNPRILVGSTLRLSRQPCTTRIVDTLSEPPRGPETLQNTNPVSAVGLLPGRMGSTL